MKNSDLKIILAGLTIVLAIAAKGNGATNSPSADLPKRVTITAPAAPKKTFILAQASVALAPIEVPVRQFPVRSDWTLIEPSLSVKAGVAKDLDSNIDMYRFNSGERWALASLTKLMTAVIAIENVGSDKTVTVSEKAMAVDGISGKLQLGEEYEVSELIKAMLVVSSNRAAVAIADFYGEQKFVDEMQSKASALGMTSTTFVEPTGLSFLNQGTVEDLEKLAGYIYKKHPEIFEITRQKSVTIHGNQLLNINSFAQSRSDFWGGKTGFTDMAGGNLVTVFNHEGRKLLLIVLGTDDRFGQTDMLYNWIKNAFIFK
jgi:D-alanyl-D-alanine carboxypeptidase